jgi:hypothetical protein
MHLRPTPDADGGAFGGRLDIFVRPLFLIEATIMHDSVRIVDSQEGTNRSKEHKPPAMFIAVTAQGSYGNSQMTIHTFQDCL